MTFCQNCGTNMDEGVKFCTSCGTAVPNGADHQQTHQLGEQHQTPAQTAPQAANNQQPVTQTPHGQPTPQPTPQLGKNAVIGTFGWLGTLILFAIPVVGFVLCIVWAFGSSNQNRRNFSRACLILSLIVIALSAVFAFILGPMAMVAIKDTAKPYVEQFDQIKDVADSLPKLPRK